MNKPKVFIGLILLLTFTYAKGQDKIITLQKDTILCRIISISPTHIRYEQKSDNQNTIGKFIPIEQVQEYFRDSLKKEPVLSVSNINQSEEPFERWRIGIQGGGAYLLPSYANSKKEMQNAGVTKSQADEYHKRLRNGMFAGADVHFFLTPFFGVGLRYSLFATSVQMDLSIRDNSYVGVQVPIYYTVGEKDNIYVNYIGPSVVFQNWLDKNRKFRLTEELSLGYAFYRQETRYDPYKYVFSSSYGAYIYNALTEGGAFGGSIQASLEYYPVSWLSVGANVGLFSATFTTLNISTKNESYESKLDKSNYQNLLQLDYSIGVRFHF